MRPASKRPLGQASKRRGSLTARALRSGAALWALMLSACSLEAEFPEGRLSCSQANECPPDWVCRKPDLAMAGLCYRTEAHDDLDGSLAEDAGLDANGPEGGQPGPDSGTAQDDSGISGDGGFPDSGSGPGDAGPGESDAGNPNAPTVSGILLTKRFLNPSMQTNVSCFASAPDHAPISYLWNASAGSLENPATASTKYTAGAIGPATLTCKATTNAGSGQASAVARVYPSGWLTYLPFTLDSQDQSGSGNHATVTGGVFVNDRSGRTGAAIGLTGADSIILDHADAFSLTAWSVVLTLKSTGHGGTLFNKAESGFGMFTLFEYPDSDPSLASRLQYMHQGSGGPFSILVGSYKTQSSGFVQLAITRSAAGQLKAYVDGTLIHTENNLPAATQNTAPVAFGAGPLGGWAGTMDEIQIYNRALEANEASALVNMQ